MIASFVLANSAHGAMIVSHLDYNRTPEGDMYGVGAQIIHRGAYEPDEVAQICALLEVRRKHFGDGVVMIDAGANIGVHTLEAAKLMHGWGEVLAIEAQERIYYALCGNIALQNCFNARAFHAAVGNHVGQYAITEPDYRRPSSFGSWELKDLRERAENIGQPIDHLAPTSEVSAISIDSLHLTRVDLIKIDVEGMEAEVLAGAEKTIERCKPILIVEHIKVDRQALVRALGELGYECLPMGMNTLAIPKDADYVKRPEETAENLCDEAVRLGDAGDADGALKVLDRLLDRFPDYELGRLNRAHLLMQTRRWEDAIGEYDRLSTGRFAGPAKFGRGFSNLVLGRLKEGFVGFEYRKKRELPDMGKPEWNGSADIKGKTILIAGEMGFGDNLMFLRYARLLVERGAHVVAAVPPAMIPLARCLPEIQVHTEHSPPFDYWVHMMSLAHRFGTDIDTVPPPASFELPLDQVFRFRLPRDGKLKVGLCWSGSRDSQYDEHRNVPLAALETLFEVKGVELYSLQIDVREADKETFDRLPFFDVGSKLKNFRDTACFIKNLDLVITVDTSMAHLAGTIGVPTWVMLTSFRTYWLWIKDREDNPWYPSARAFQQRADGEWGEVVDRIKAELSFKAASKDAPAGSLAAN